MQLKGTKSYFPENPPCLGNLWEASCGKLIKQKMDLGSAEALAT